LPTAKYIKTYIFVQALPGWVGEVIALARPHSKIYCGAATAMESSGRSKGVGEGGRGAAAPWILLPPIAPIR